jgi:hypothetical protein
MGTKRLPKKAPCTVESLGVDRLTTYLHIAGITLAVGDGDTLSISYDGEALPEWLKEAIAHYKGEILDIMRPSPECVQKRQAFQLIFDYVCRLRYEDPSKGTREAAIAWLSRKLAAFADTCEYPDGYCDPGDPFATDALAALKIEFGELTAEGNPYPIPVDDPRPRTASGKLETPFPTLTTL